MPTFLVLWNEYSDALKWAVAGVVGYLGNAAQTRIKAQRNTIDSQALALKREESLTNTIVEQVSENRDLTRSLFACEGVLLAYHAAAIGARLSVHERESLLAVALTKFDPLPGYPPAVSVLVSRNTPTETADAPVVAGDQAASTADPGAGNTHR